MATWLTLKEARLLTGKSESTIRRGIKAETFKAHKKDGRWLFEREGLVTAYGIDQFGGQSESSLRTPPAAKNDMFIIDMLKDHINRLQMELDATRQENRRLHDRIDDLIKTRQERFIESTSEPSQEKKPGPISGIFARFGL